LLAVWLRDRGRLAKRSNGLGLGGRSRRACSSDATILALDELDITIVCQTETRVIRLLNCLPERQSQPAMEGRDACSIWPRRRVSLMSEALETGEKRDEGLIIALTDRRIARDSLLLLPRVVTQALEIREQGLGIPRPAVLGGLAEV